MDTSREARRRGHRAIQAGVTLFLLAMLVGFAIPKLALPRLGLSAHLLGIMQGLFLMIGGVLWPRLDLSNGMSRAGHVLLLYGCFAAWAANVLGAIVGAGGTMLPMATGGAHGSAFVETLLAVGLRTAAVSLVAGTLVVLWGLRRFTGDGHVGSG